MRHLLWLTQRSPRHQKAALESAPPTLHVTIQETPSPAALAEAEFLISERRGLVTAEMLDRMPHLKLIVRLGSLTDDIDLEACQQRHIMVSRQPVDVAITVSEHVVMQILALLKHLNEAQAITLAAESALPPARTDENTFRYNWSRFQKVTTLQGKHIAIIGMGEIGVETARRLRAFLPAQISYFKRTPFPDSVEQQLGIGYADFETCTTQADVLVCLLPYSPHTDKLLNAHVFAHMKPDSLLAHAGSGSVIDEQALVDALLRGQLAGAALDTYEYEPLPPHHALITAARVPANNLILTPHIAAGVGSPRRDSDYTEVVRFLNGEPLLYRVV